VGMSVRRFTPESEPKTSHPRGTIRRKRHFRFGRAFTFVSFAVLLIGIVYVFWILKDIPDPRKLGEIKAAESTKIYDRTGTNLLYEFGQVHRTWVGLDQISPYLRNATVAIEDKDFYKHGGISVTGIMRALLADLRGKATQGGSSITQQLVKIQFLTPEKTLTRKIREAVLALQVDRQLTKEQILENYLNIIPYGANASGAEAAAQAFFGTSAKDLTLPQAAILAALPNAPSLFSPYGSHVDRLYARQRAILDAMAKQGYITKEEAEAAKEVKITFRKRADRIVAPHFVFYVREQLEKEYGDTVLESGLKITTTLDLNMQRAAEDAVAKQAPKNAKRNAKNAAFVALNPKNGDVLSMVGSVDYFDTDNDGNVNVAIRPRSPGSSFKPIVYTQLLREGYTAETVFNDVPIDFGTPSKPYRPLNYNKTFSGPVTMRQALAQSLNVPAVQALYLAGMKDTLALARDMGFTSLTDPDRFGLSLVLGGGEVRLIDLVSAYSIFATEGLRHPVRSILKVEDPSKRVLYDITRDQPQENRVLDAEIARGITDILSDNGARAPVFGTGSPLQLGARPVAAKTGTAQEYRDGWTIGFTPSLVAGVWVGNNNNTPMQAESGVEAAAPIWNSFMRTVLNNTPIEYFTKPKPSNLDKVVLNGKLPEKTYRYDKDSGTILPSDCPVAVGQTTNFINFRSILYFLSKDNPRGDQPQNPESDPMFAQWEAGVSSWRDKWNKEHPNEAKKYVDNLPDVSCSPDMFEDLPSISFTSPVDQTIKKSPVKVSADINAPDRVTKVEFYANDQKIGERKEEPWEALYKFPSSTSGQVVLKIRATTEKNRIGQASRTILVNPDSSVPRVNLLTPWPNDTLTAEDFPFNVKVSASDPSGLRAVDVLYKPLNGDKTTRIGRIDNPTQNGSLFEITWKDIPAPGEYEIWAQATDKTGNKAQTSAIKVTVP